MCPSETKKKYNYKSYLEGYRLIKHTPVILNHYARQASETIEKSKNQICL